MSYIIRKSYPVTGRPQDFRWRPLSLHDIGLCICGLCALVITGCGGAPSTMTMAPMIQTTTILSATPPLSYLAQLSR